ncbi:MAG: tetratricopeptide repeat protein [Actinomycetota bacterium]
MRDLPSGTVTFLFTDIEGSTKLLHELGAEAYADALVEHRRVLREAFGAHGGVEVDNQGDALFVAFPTAPGALEAAADAVAGLAPGPIRVRIGVHTGTPHVSEEGYVGLDVHKAARIGAAGHGGQVLVSQTTRALVDADLPLDDLGEHRLKDLSAPQHLWQLGPGEFPPLKTLHQTNLPVQPGPLVGRQRELREAGKLLREQRLVTLTGPGGSGKTRLALQVAAEAVADFPDGVWLVSLAELTDPRLVLASVSRTLGARGDLKAHLGSKRLLLLIDNLEHLIDSAPQLAELLATGEQVKLLVTSREPLRIGGEHEYAVSPLEIDEAVDLFVERARAVNADFPVADHTEVLREICARLDGLPLAIELAAARAKVLSPEALRDRLQERLRLLTRERRDVPERQRTLRATIEWSHALLHGEEQNLFARLAVFVGGCTLDAAEDVCETSLDALASLVDKSLLRWSNERFEMLETIREYAVEHLGESADRDTWRTRHADYFLGLANRAEPNLYGPDQSLWLERIETEHANLNAAREFLTRAGDGERALELTAAIWRFLSIRGRLGECRTWLEETLSGTAEPTETRVRALVGASMSALRQGDHPRARERITETIELARQLEYTWGIAAAINHLGILSSAEGDEERAEAFYAESLPLFRDAGDERMVCTCIHNLGVSALYRGDYDRATKLLEEGLAIARSIQSKRDVAGSLVDLGLTALLQGDLEEAHSLLQESLALSEEDLELNIPWCLAGLAAVAAAESQAERGAFLLGAADRLAETLGVSLVEASFDRKLREQTIAGLRQDLDEQALTACLAEGRSKTLEEVLAFALRGLGARPSEEMPPA